MRHDSHEDSEDSRFRERFLADWLVHRRGHSREFVVIQEGGPVAKNVSQIFMRVEKKSRTYDTVLRPPRSVANTGILFYLYNDASKDDGSDQVSSILCDDLKSEVGHERRSGHASSQLIKVSFNLVRSVVFLLELDWKLTPSLDPPFEVNWNAQRGSVFFLVKVTEMYFLGCTCLH